MELEQSLETIVGTVCTLGFGLGLYIFGVWAGRQIDKPIGFWANGEKLNPKSVSDIPAYNREFGKLLRLFSLPLCISGIVMLMSSMSEWIAAVSLVILVLWGIFGLWWLIRSYKKIEKKFILQ